jgi:hypothetical protein
MGDLAVTLFPTPPNCSQIARMDNVISMAMHNTSYLTNRYARLEEAYHNHVYDTAQTIQVSSVSCFSAWLL